MTNEEIDALAVRLEAAEKERRQIRQFSLDFPGISIDNAYAIQQAWVRRKVEQGRRVRGHKIGLTSKAMQNSSNISEPDYGVLLDDMFFEDGADIPVQRFIMPRVEVELAFLLAGPLRGPHCTLFDVLRATEFVTPAIEIIDARIQPVDPETGVTRKVFDTIADNAASAGLVLGGRPFRPMEADMRSIAAVAYRNANVEESGVAAAVLNHPANGVVWLANKLAAYDVELQAGEVLLSGSFTRPIPARAGDTFHVDYGEFGCLMCHFS